MAPEQPNELHGRREWIYWLAGAVSGSRDEFLMG
jgi:hypothetical protein